MQAVRWSGRMLWLVVRLVWALLLVMTSVLVLGMGVLVTVFVLCGRE